MRKTRIEACWNQLSAEQRDTLDQWLFEENMSYAKAFPFAQAKLGFKGSLASLKRYGVRRRKEQVMEEFQDLRDELVTLSGAPTDPKEIHAGSVKLMERYLFKRLQDSPDDIE